MNKLLLTSLLVLLLCSLIGITETIAQFTPSYNGYRSFKRAQKKYENRESSGKRVGFFKGLHIGYNYAVPPDVTFEHHFSGGMNGETPYGPHSDIRTVRSLPVTSATWGSYFSITKFSDKSMLAFTYGMEMVGVAAETGEIKHTDVYTRSGYFEQIGLSFPLGVAVKVGDEASLSKESGFSVSLGAALAPSFIFTEYNDLIKDAQYRTLPLLHLSVGFFAGIQWNIRGSMIPVGIATFKKNPEDLGMDFFHTDTHLNVRTGPVYQVGLSIMPFSYKWESYKW